MHPIDPRGGAATDPCRSCAGACGGAMSDGLPRDEAQPRREFLRDAGAILAGIAAAVGGLAPERAAALTLDFTTASRAAGAEATYAIPTADGATIDADREVILARDRGAVYAFSLSCPHQRTRLKWWGEQQRFQCPKHKSAYQPDGTFISGRATRGMDRYAIRRAGNTVVVDLAKLFQQDKDLAGWNGAVVKL